jgi:hypothetical protein
VPVKPFLYTYTVLRKRRFCLQPNTIVKDPQKFTKYSKFLKKDWQFFRYHKWIVVSLPKHI